MHKYARQKSKLDKLFSNIIQGFLGLFVGKQQQVVSGLSTLSVRAAGAKLYGSSLTGVDIWPEAQMARKLRDGQKI